MPEELLGQELPGTPVLRILVVDDDESINRLLCARLIARGFNTEAAFNGEEAVAYIASSPPDLIFLDVSMPGMDGLDVLREVRTQGLDLGVIMTTAFGSEQIAMEALRLGADDYMRKPFEPIEFHGVLDRTVAGLMLRRENAALRQRLSAELALASQVQVDLLPQNGPSIPNFEYAARCIAAREVGGDYYDWLMPTPGTLVLVAADVMGKGMPAALLMATVRAAVRAVVGESAPAEALTYVLNAIGDDLIRSESFVTLFLGKLDIETKRLDYVDAGHGLAFMMRQDRSIKRLEIGGLPIGVTAHENYTQGEVTFRAGDSLVIYSDGLLDTVYDAAHEPQRPLEAIKGTMLSASDIVEQLVGLAVGVKPLSDDLTIVVLQCTA